jgi:hypothetical protein
MKKTKQQPAEEKIIKLDLGCGRNKLPGYVGVDLYSPDADVKHDLFKFPFPFASDSITEIHASHFIEHIPHQLRWPFFEECYRILKMDGTMRIFVPSWKSERAYGDMTHQWPPVTAMAFYYLNKGWREANKLTYGQYALKCNFDHAAGPTAISAGFAQRSHETQVFACTHYLEAYQDMWVTLTKKPI